MTESEKGLQVVPLKSSALEAVERSTHSKQYRDLPMHVNIAKLHNWMVADANYEQYILKRCSEKKYENMSSYPNVSVVITFHESEKLIYLLHTLHSIVKHSPAELIQEIIMINDNSSKVEHVEILENYVSRVFLGLVKVIRSNISLGLIRARQLGISLAIADVVCSMDAHMEVQEGWLFPILNEIQKDSRVMVTPYLDWMKPQTDGTWVYEHGSSRYKTVWFWWNMFFTFMEVPYDFKNDIDPTKSVLSPCSVGTIWAINRNFFFEIGGLDEGMSFWGGENIDLPLRVFLFGGKHVHLPCSHAAHLEEKGQRSYRSGKLQDTVINYLRVVETWFTPEYKDIIYYYNPSWKNKDYGDISRNLQFKEKAIYNFTYYMKTFYPEMKAPGINSLAWGEVQNVGLDNAEEKGYCLCAYPNQYLVTMDQCNRNVAHNKGIFLTNDGELRLAVHIITPSVRNSKMRGSVTVANYVTVYNTSKIPRFLHYKGGPIQVYRNGKTENQCLSVEMENTQARVITEQCNDFSPFQKWIFKIYTDDYYKFVNNNILPIEGDKGYFSAMEQFIQKRNSIF